MDLINNLTILEYHEVTQTEDDALLLPYAMTKETFEKQILDLKDKGFNFVSADDVLKAKANQTQLPQKAVLLTFNDGYASFYDCVYPFIEQYKIPVVLSVVGQWIDTPMGQSVQVNERKVARDGFLTWEQLRELSASEYVEIASQSYDLNKGVVGNPQGDLQPAAIARIYNPKQKMYEADSQYKQRIVDDLSKNNTCFELHQLPTPRVMVWPFGLYHLKAVAIAEELGMSLSLGQQITGSKTEPNVMSRILVTSDMDINDLLNEISLEAKQIQEYMYTQKIMHVDLDYIYDEDVKQEQANIKELIRRIQKMGITTVYLQAFSDDDANGSASLVYFPNRYLPVRKDLFNHVAWQIFKQTQVRRVYAWMPLLAWELPKSNPIGKHLVETHPTEDGSQHTGYIRLSPFSYKARRVIRGLYDDLGKYTPLNGILFHDDVTLSDYEDISEYALKAYAQAGLPTDIETLRKNPSDLKKWTTFKTTYLDQLALQMVDVLRQYQPNLATARNLYAEVALNSDAQEWYAQSLEKSIELYDFTSIMAMPYMEQATNKDKFYQDILTRVKSYPNGVQKTVMELQAVDWANDSAPISSLELANTVKFLYDEGAVHVGYYPDDAPSGHPNVNKMRDAFAYLDTLYHEKNQ